MKHKTNTSYVQIIFSLLLFFSFFQLERFLTVMTLSKTISITVLLNTFMLIILLFNYKLIMNHFHRFFDALKENIFYTLIGCIMVGLLFVIDYLFLKSGFPVVEKAIVFAYPFFFPFIFFAFCCSTSFCCCTALKLFTDRLHLGKQEKYIILLSGILFGLLTALCELPLPWLQIIRNFALYTSIGIIAAYLYNQTSSIFPMMISFSFVLFIYNLMLVFVL